ncbi:MAG: UDP-N-acetylmuramate--L-alanine ligase [Oscillospiraceae bacterium]|nr:UDP-N-acetylmuramate--L-alanine ligase [Oscillospiraceae bacterium]
MREYKSIYFIGIGGSSMSGLAEIMLEKGVSIIGSDRTSNALIEKLMKNGAKIHIGHSSSNMEDVDLVVYSAAISSDNEELLKAKELGIKTLERSEFLGMIMEDYKYNICISGTHGKTTTTSMISSIFLMDKKDPTITIGGELDLIDGNVRIGKNDYFIVESCEYRDSFLKFHPFLAVVTNIEPDHLDYFKDLNQILKSFNEFVSMIPKDGCLVINAEHPNTKDIIDDFSGNMITFGLKYGDVYAENIKFTESGYPNFDVIYKDELYINVSLSVPGMHNILNALAAIATSIFFDIDKLSIIQGLKQFKTPHRRFYCIGEINDVKVIDEYSHHPTEIRAAVSSLKNMHINNIYMVFQPHTYSRTKSLYDEFCKCFNGLDNLHLIITDIYAAREKDPGDINSKMLADSIKDEGIDVTYMKDFEEIAKYIKSKVSKDDVVITVGAGDVNKIGKAFLNYL